MLSSLKLTWRRVLLVLLVILVIALSGFVLWASTPSGTLMPEALNALESDEAVTVGTDGWLSFTPAEAQGPAGLILYPGGRVQAEAYAPIAREVAEAGYYAAIVYAPLNLAFFNVNAAAAVMDANPQIEHWVIGGHSLGGVAASLFVEGRDDVQGLMIMASYPAGAGLANREDLRVTSLYGTRDGLASPEAILESASNLPEDTQFVSIEGGNHAQFGFYGNQAGDESATISRDEQLAQIVAQALSLLTDEPDASGAGGSGSVPDTAEGS